jgi:hypothetical protein
MTSLAPTNRGNAASASVVDFGSVVIPDYTKLPHVEHLPVITKENLNGVKYINYLFANNSNLKNIKFEQGSCATIIGMEKLASECLSLETIEFADMPEIRNISAALACYTSGMSNKITSVNVPSLPKVENVYSMFYGCENLETAIVGDLGLDTTNALNVSYLFYRCKKLKSVVLGDISGVKSVVGIKWLFNLCSELEDVSIKALPAVNMVDNEFSTCSKLTGQSYANILAALPNTSSNTIKLHTSFSTIKESDNKEYTAFDAVGGYYDTFNLIDWYDYAVSKGWTIMQ